MRNEPTSLSDIKIPKEFWDFYKKLGEELKYSNRFNVSKDLQERIKKYIQYHLKRKTFKLKSGNLFYRARINAIDKNAPYERENMGAPPRGQANSGRINPEGISYLYLAKSIDTAIAEVRPWVGAKISVAKFILKKDIDIVSLQHTKHSNVKDYEIDDIVRDLLNSTPINQFYFASPAHNADRLAYLPSQYLAELFKSEGMDGLEYGSVLHRNGENLALFDVSIAECLDVELHSISEVHYSSSLVADERKN
ncbi:RES family NAD+ phosphorylase [Pseudomonas caspiana]|uniref:RES domain-containing protein n=1 Tax=Pseudomonas caspiana TaxID=1451454 RepID=A0A1Y3NXN0_9PSED|nr:RES family NAD+ phosphorylase [Pseudomonas caspiana]OUM70951.1 hypothetical protein AUC60_25695 [Pseudomonas caspiana]